MASTVVFRETSTEPAVAPSTIELPERLAAAAALLAVSPLLCVSAAVLAVGSKRSPLIAHKRVGWRGSTLWMLKLRTMWDNQNEERSFGWIERIDDESGPMRKDRSDSRVPSAFARLCRRHSIDELPQLWHVIRGEMSLVGPRPLTRRELRLHYGSATQEILEARPGISGLWQTSGRNNLTYAERREFDLQLVRARSLRLYLRILLRTVAEVWSGTNTW